jgi:hypothetical protein
MADGGGASTPVPATNETPPAARWRFAGAMAVGGLAVSAVIHVALVGTVLVMGSWDQPPAPVKAVPVDMVTPDELADMTEKAKTQPTSPATPDPSPADTPAQAQPSPQAQPPPAPQASSASRPPQSAVPPPALPALDAFAPPFAPPAVPAASAPPPPPTEQIGQAALLAQRLGLPAPVAGLSGGPPSDVKANLTSDEVAGFAAHVQSCWTALPAMANASKLTVFIRVRLRPDGSLAGNPEPLGGSASMQALTLLKNSLDTLKHCSAYTALPAAKYDEWRVLDLHFTPNGISTATPVPSHRR